MMKKSETGRSMVEMLGVLAIVGVLSIGGIAAYILAMNKSKANNISQAVRIDITQLLTAEDQADVLDPEVTSVSGATLDYFDVGADSWNAGVQVDFGEGNEKTCRQFYEMYKDDADYFIKARCGGTEM